MPSSIRHLVFMHVNREKKHLFSIGKQKQTERTESVYITSYRLKQCLNKYQAILIRPRRITRHVPFH